MWLSFPSGGVSPGGVARQVLQKVVAASFKFVANQAKAEHPAKEIIPAVAATSFHWKKIIHHYENPQQQAEYLYSLIESEAI